jgi:hypothetical protein
VTKGDGKRFGDGRSKQAAITMVLEHRSGLEAEEVVVYKERAEPSRAKKL